MCIWSSNIPIAPCLNITWLEGLSILKAAASSFRNLSLFETCKTAPENWLVTPWAVTFSTLPQNQAAVSERPFSTLVLGCFVLSLVGLVLDFMLFCFFKWAGLLRPPHQRLRWLDDPPGLCRQSWWRQHWHTLASSPSPSQHCLSRSLLEERAPDHADSVQHCPGCNLAREIKFKLDVVLLSKYFLTNFN